MMPASRRQLALKDMNEADGAPWIGKISCRFTGAFMVLTRLCPICRKDRHRETTLRGVHKRKAHKPFTHEANDAFSTYATLEDYVPGRVKSDQV
jgi:hypothetical protein